MPALMATQCDVTSSGAARAASPITRMPGFSPDMDAPASAAGHRPQRPRGFMRNYTFTPPTPAIVRSSPEWKPEPCDLTREQIRAIIIEQIG